MRIHSIASLKNSQKGDYREAGGSVVSINIANERDITIAKVNTDTNQLKMGQFGFRGIPALVLYHNGQPVDQQAGALPKAGFDDWLNRHMN